MRGFIGTSSLVKISHPITDIEVETRYQFTKSDLMHKIERHGIKVTNIYPVNYQKFNPVIDGEQLITEEANRQNNISRWPNWV